MRQRQTDRRADRQTDNTDHCYSGPNTVTCQLINWLSSWLISGVSGSTMPVTQFLSGSPLTSPATSHAFTTRLTAYRHDQMPPCGGATPTATDPFTCSPAVDDTDAVRYWSRRSTSLYRVAPKNLHISIFLMLTWYSFVKSQPNFIIFGKLTPE